MCYLWYRVTIVFIILQIFFTRSFANWRISLGNSLFLAGAYSIMPNLVWAKKIDSLIIIITCDIKSPYLNMAWFMSTINISGRWQAGLVSPWVRAGLLLAKIQTMARPNSPDMLPRHTKKAELRISIVNNKQQFAQRDVMGMKKRLQIDFKNRWRKKQPK